MQQNKKVKVYLQLLTPSAIGAVFYTFAAAMIIFMNQFGFIERTLQIPGDVNFMRMFLDWLDHTVNHVIGQSGTETIVVGLFWAGVGLAVYVFLRGVARFFTDFAEGLDERRYVWPQGVNRNQVLLEVLRRTAFRVFAAIGLLIVVFGPLSGLLDGPEMENVDKSLQYVVWFAMTWLVLHICVILIRLVALKPRLFNS